MKSFSTFRRSTGVLLVLWAVLCGHSDVAAQEPEQLPLFLRFDGGGVDNIVKAVQWSPDGRTLYVAGWNKTVQIYRFDEETQKFVYTPRQNFRIPIDAGRSGMIEAMLVSPNGRTLVVAGSAWSGIPAAATAWLWPRSAATETDWRQTGTIYVFDTVTRDCRVLRGHQGGVRQLAFIDNGGEPTKLVSLGFEYAGQKISQSVRMWSLETGGEMSQPLLIPHVLIPPSTDIPPRIQAWETSTAEVQVAVGAWKVEGSNPVSDLLIWNPADAADPRRLTAAPVALALQVTGRGTARKLFCGGIGPARLLSVGDGQRASSQSLAGSSAELTPFAAENLPDKAGLPQQRLAIVSVRGLSGGDKEYSLSVLEGTKLRPAGVLWVNRPIAPLATAPTTEPAISVSPNGQFLAVAGSSNNEVRIYTLNEALSLKSPAGELKPMQILTGRSLMPDSVVFAQKEQNIGIAVGTRLQTSLRSVSHGQAIPAETVVFDAEERSVRSDSSGWTALRPDAGGWTTRAARDRHTVEVSHGSSAPRLLRVPPSFRAEGFDEEVSAHAVCPALGDNPALAAVATHVQGEPFIHLFAAESGQCLRMLKGHERRITDLAFSADGRFLVSAALDGTVRGWLVEDLGSETIGHVGWLRGLMAKSVGDQVQVETVEAGSAAAQADVRAGDVVTGIVSSGQLSALATAAQFYSRISQTPPGSDRNVVLRLLRGTQSLDASVTLEQGADVREPLFSMLLSDPSAENAAGTHEWIVWSPLGQFDVLGPQLEQRLGWHINTGNDQAPVSFSSIDQFRERFLHEGLLKQLLQRAQAEVRKAVPPEMRLSLTTSGGEMAFPNYDDELVLREPDGQLILSFENQTGEFVSDAEWSAATQAVRPFSAVERDLWTAPVSATDLGRTQPMLANSVCTPSTKARAPARS